MSSMATHPVDASSTRLYPQRVAYRCASRSKRLLVSKELWHLATFAVTEMRSMVWQESGDG